ncbi:hypothetical protein [Nioella aestuarii]|uniref:hypothetical protein n=1 Tax=Nioella aestuarii TaxID=1662864 RepID=UPI003D7F6CCB
MKRSLLAFFLCASPALADGVQILDGYSDFRVPEVTSYDQPMTLVSDWVLGFPEEGEGRPALNLSSAIGDDGHLTIEITETGLADDSVSAVQRRYVLERTETGWTLVGYGHRQQCWRGETSEWTASACS